VGLIKLEHPRRLSSPAEAEAFYRALGESRVSARGYHTEDPARIERLVDAVDPLRANTVSFLGGAFDRATLDAFVKTGCYEYFDLRTAAQVSLRVWPELYSWVHATPAQIREQAANNPGTTIDRETTLVIPKRDFTTALRAFHAVAEPVLDRGFAMKLGAPGKAPYAACLLAMRAKVDVVLDVEVSVARSLTELFSEPHDWQAGGVLVPFPDLAITGFVRAYIADQERAAWFERVDKALAKLRVG
jgi:hypothetical protein